MSDIDTVRELTFAELDAVGGGTYSHHKHHFEKDWGKGHHDHHHGKHHQKDANGDGNNHHRHHHQKKSICAV